MRESEHPGSLPPQRSSIRPGVLAASFPSSIPGSDAADAGTDGSFRCGWIPRVFALPHAGSLDPGLIAFIPSGWAKPDFSSRRKLLFPRLVEDDLAVRVDEVLLIE